MRTRATPWDRSRDMLHHVSTLGRRPPPVWGGSLSSFSSARVRIDPGRFKAANHGGMRHIEESGFAAFLDLSMLHPPL